MINCFRKCGFSNKAQDGDVKILNQDVQILDQNEDEELTNLVKELTGDAEAEDYVGFYKDIASSMSVVNAGSISWR